MATDSHAILSARTEDTPPPVGQERFRPDIQGLRGIAILLVVAFHAGIPVFRGGFVGVDVFFVLSGYLITSLLVQEAMEKGRIHFLSFYARRARRILPASMLMLVVTMGASYFVFPPLEQDSIAQSARATAAYISNLWFTGQSGNYFSPDVEANPLLHTWSLAVEEQFYLLWPLVIAVALWRTRSKKVLAGVMCLIAIVSLADCLRLMKLGNAWAFYGSTPRAWEFAVGGLASLVPFGTISFARSRLLQYGGLAAVLSAGIWYSSATVFPGMAAALPVFGTATLLIGGTIGANRFLKSPPMQRIGNLSYSWYLWHWPVLVMAAALVPALPVWAKLLCAGGSLVLAAFTHRLFENPIRFHPYLLRHPAISLGLALALTLSLYGAATIWERVAVNRPEYRRFAHARGDLPRVYALGCMGGTRSEKVEECSFGAGSAETAVVLFGDSHAAQWFPALNAVAEQRQWRLITILRSACPAANVTVLDAKLRTEIDSCRLWRDAALKRITTIHPSVVVIGNVFPHAILPSQPSGSSSSPYEEWRKGTRMTLENLSSSADRVILVRDTPNAQLDPIACLAAAQWRGWGSCSAPRTLALNAGLYQAEQLAANGLEHVSLLDLSDRICEADVCEPLREGMFVYQDRTHLSATFTNSLASILSTEITRRLPGR